MSHVFVLSCVCYVLCASVYMCFVVTCWERADLLALVCGVFCEFVTFPLVSWVRCGTWLYRFLIFATLLTFIHWLYWNSRSLSSSDVIVMLKWRHQVKLYLSVVRDFWKLISKLKKQWWARKRIHYSCEGRIEKSVPRDHRLSSLGKPRDAKRWSSGRIFLSFPHTHDRFL